MVMNSGIDFDQVIGNVLKMSRLDQEKNEWYIELPIRIVWENYLAPYEKRYRLSLETTIITRFKECGEIHHDEKYATKFEMVMYIPHTNDAIRRTRYLLGMNGLRWSNIYNKFVKDVYNKY